MMSKKNKVKYNFGGEGNKYYVTLCGKRYYINLEALQNVCFLDIANDNETEITEHFEKGDDNEYNIQNKIIRQFTGSKTSNVAIYDCVKMFIIKLLENEQIADFETCIDDNEDITTDLVFVNVGTALAMNTLIKYGILSEVE